MYTTPDPGPIFLISYFQKQKKNKQSIGRHENPFDFLRMTQIESFSA
jgi:hypothetical protein